jgi:hypothetical protein
MTLRTTVLPLGFGLSALLCVAIAPAHDASAPASHPSPRVYTNADLDRVHPFRGETGVHSVPAATPAEPAPAAASDRRLARRGEDYWRREAARVRERVRALEAQAGELRARIAEQAEQEGRQLVRNRRASPGSSSVATLRARLLGLERRRRQTEDDLAERARREGALPGWLR